MSDCTARDGYLDQTLSAEARADYEAHLSSCAACQAAVGKWSSFGESLKVAYAPLHQPPSLGEIARLKAKAEEPPAARSPLRFVLAGLAAVAVIGLAVQLLRPAPETLWQPQVVAGLEATASLQLIETSVKGGALIQLGEDEVGLGAGSKLHFIRAGSRGTELQLERGVIAARVNAHGKRPFEIETPLGKIRVVGTVFRVDVTGEQLDVQVLEGVVTVTPTGGNVIKVKAGQRWSGGAEPSAFTSTGFAELEAPHAPAPVVVAPVEPEAVDAGVVEVPHAAVRSPLPDWRSRAARGECAVVSVELERFLKTSPGSADGWLLLGDCRRRNGSAQSAVDAYRRAAKSHDTDGERGLLLAASLLQDELNRPAEAVPLLDQYIARKPETRSLEAAALVRQARAFVTLGKVDKAKAVLTRVITRYRDTPAAAEASRLKEGL